MCYQERLKVKGTSIYLSEDLSKDQASLFYKARKKKSQDSIHSAWTKDCKVFIRRSADHERELTSNLTELSDLAVNPLDSTPAMPGILAQPAGMLATTTPSPTAVYHHQAPPTVLQPSTMPE